MQEESQANPRRPVESPWSFEIGRWFGISVRVHATFGLLLVWVVAATAPTGSLTLLLASLGFIGLIFTFVVMHEYGHALAARRFGIETRQITLLPIGGMAQLERMPDRPIEQLWVALAGPAVNFALAGVAAAALFALYGGLDAVLEGGVLGGSLLAMTVRINLVMGLFNLLPALPMDGGRVLRALLALRLPALQATEIATACARVLALAMGGLAFAFGETLLFVIALFVWIASSAELRAARATAQLERLLGRKVQDGEWATGPGGSVHVRIVTRGSDGRPHTAWLQVPKES